MVVGLKGFCMLYIFSKNECIEVYSISSVILQIESVDYSVSMNATK